jgi:hypothetical protein
MEVVNTCCHAWCSGYKGSRNNQILGPKNTVSAACGQLFDVNFQLIMQAAMRLMDVTYQQAFSTSPVEMCCDRRYIQGWE